MSTIAQSIDGEAVTTRLAMRMEDSLQAFAVRAACFIGELDLPYSEEFDGHDFGATHILAYVGNERWERPCAGSSPSPCPSGWRSSSASRPQDRPA
jgi:hypothetical protein